MKKPRKGGACPPGCTAAEALRVLKAALDNPAETIPGEDPDELSELAACYRSEYQPQTPAESVMVDSLARNAWLERRYARLESAVFATLMMQHDDSASALSGVYLEHSKLIDQIARRCLAASNSFQRTMKALRALRPLREGRRHLGPVLVPNSSNRVH